MHIAQRVGAALAIGPAGQRAAQNHLRLRALAPGHHQLKSLGVTAGCVEKIQFHTAGDDACRVVANAHQRTQQRHLLLFAGARRILSDAHRDAVNLQKLRQVAHAVVLEKIRPHQLPEHRRALQITTLGLVDVRDPAKGLQRLAHTAISRRRVAAQAQLLAVAAMHREPRLRAMRNRLRQPIPARLVPLNFRTRKALANGVCHVEQHILKIRQLAHQLGQLLGSG